MKKILILSLALINLSIQALVPAKRTLSEDACVKKIYQILKDSLSDTDTDKEMTHNRLKGLMTRHDKHDQPWEIYKKVEDYAQKLGDEEVAQKARNYWYFTITIELGWIKATLEALFTRKQKITEEKYRLTDKLVQLDNAEQAIAEKNQEVVARSHALQRLINKCQKSIG